MLSRVSFGHELVDDGSGFAHGTAPGEPSASRVRPHPAVEGEVVHPGDPEQRAL